MQEFNEENNSMEFKKENIIKSYSIKIGIIILIGIILCITWNSISSYNSYTKAMQLLDSEEYDLAEDIFLELNNYKDSAEMVKETKYRKALKNKNEGKYEEAIAEFQELDNYKDCISLINETKYTIALKSKEEGKYEEAIEGFEELGEYSDSESMLKESRYLYANILLENKNFSKAWDVFEEIWDYKDSETKIKEVKYQYANNCINNKNFEYAYSLLKQIHDYKDVFSILKKFRFRLKQEITTDTDTNEQSYVDYIYDKNNKLIEKTITEKDENGKIKKVNKVETPTPPEVQPIDKANFYEKNNESENEIIKFNDGRPKRINIYGSNGKLLKWYEFQYNEKDLVIREDTAFGNAPTFNGEIIDGHIYSEYEYDVCDNITSIKTYAYGDDRLMSTTKMSYDVFYNE